MPRTTTKQTIHISQSKLRCTGAYAVPGVPVVIGYVHIHGSAFMEFLILYVTLMEQRDILSCDNILLSSQLV